MKLELSVDEALGYAEKLALMIHNRIPSQYFNSTETDERISDSVRMVDKLRQLLVLVQSETK